LRFELGWLVLRDVFDIVAPESCKDSDKVFVRSAGLVGPRPSSRTANRTALVSSMFGPGCFERLEGACLSGRRGQRSAGRRAASWKLTLLCRRRPAGRKLEAYSALPTPVGGPQAGSLRYFAGAGRRAASLKLTLLCQPRPAGGKLAILTDTANGPFRKIVP